MHNMFGFEYNYCIITCNSASNACLVRQTQVDIQRNISYRKLFQSDPMLPQCHCSWLSPPECVRNFHQIGLPAEARAGGNRSLRVFGSTRGFSNASPHIQVITDASFDEL